MSSDFKFIGKNILHNGERLFTLPFIVKNIEVFQSVIVILEDYKQLSPGNNSENVYGYSYDGQKIWQIEKMDYLGRSFSPYTGIYKLNSEIALYNRAGIEVIVDPTNGNILKRELIK
jgi:hypothetical protein